MSLTFAIQPHVDGNCCNNSDSIIFVKPAICHMMFPREHGQFGRQCVGIFHHASAHFL